MAGSQYRRGRAGMAYNVIVFLATLTIGALLIIALNGPFGDVMAAYGSTTNTQAAATGGDYMRRAWDWAPLLIVFLGLVQLIAAALYKSKQP